MYKDIVFLDGIQDNYLQNIHSFIAEWESQSPVIKVDTSGSTGNPVTIEFNKKDIIASAKSTGEFFNFKKGDSLLLNLSPLFIAGKLMIVRAIIHEMKILVAPLKSDPFENIKSLPFEVNFGAFVPFQVEAILKNEVSTRIYNGISNVIIGGASINHLLEQQIKECSNESFATFGMTETITHFALRNINQSEIEYQCLPNVIIDSDSRGCLIILKSPGINKQILTNDIVEITSENRFIWKGRIDNVINSGGIKIHPETIENTIEYMILNRRYYLSAKKHEQLGEELILVIEGNQFTDKEETLLLNKLLQSLPRFHAPRTIIYQGKFRETKNGKLIRDKF